MTNNKNSNWEKVGICGVDAGLIWIGDPCYILDKRPGGPDLPENMKDWNKFCDSVNDGATQFKYKSGHDGIGVVVPSGHGDGVYPVYIKKNKNGMVIEAKIVFDEG
jgi:hypothetical protein